MASLAKRCKFLIRRTRSPSPCYAEDNVKASSRLCYAVRFINTESDSNLPHIKPKYPKGSWYSFSSKKAWDWFKDVNAIDKLPTIEERLYHNIGYKNQQYYFDVKPFLPDPTCVEFTEEITKSCLDSSVKAGQTTDIDSSKWLSITTDILSTINDECKNIVRDVDVSSTEDERKNRRHRLLLDSILRRLQTLLSVECPDLVSCDTERDVNLQTHWIRGGAKTPLQSFCQVGYPGGPVRYGYKQNTEYQLRSHLPLCTNHLNGVESHAKPLDPVPPEEALHEYADYHESIRKDLNTGDYNAHKRGLTKHCYSMPHQPGFMYGAPAEFVNLSLIMPTTKSVSQKWWEDQMDAKCLEESLVRAGLVHSFATANAVAHYQGYDMHHDLSSPILTQTLVFDKNTFTLITYQLNTLRLFVHDVDNCKYNAYSHTRPVQLYQSITDDGTIVGFNPQCIKMIGECMLANLAQGVAVNPHLEQQQMKTPSSGDIFPYLPKYPRFSDLPELHPGSASIPTFIRYNKPDEPMSEWDLHPKDRARRAKERKHEHEFTKGPLSDRAEPPARGKTKLDLHFAKVRQEKKRQRIEWRDEVLAYKKTQEIDKDNES